MPDSRRKLRLLRSTVNIFGDRNRQAGSRGRWHCPPACYWIAFLRNRNELLITETELKLMAKAAIIGESSRPKKG